MLRLRRFWAMEPVTTPGASAAAYVPLVMVSRGLAFLRTLLVAGILGQAGMSAFGLYQPALELINPLVVLTMFGAADVTERYISLVERREGDAGVRRWLKGLWGRVLLTGVVIALAMAAGSPWIGPAIWYTGQRGLTVACAATIVILALYQCLAAALRGLRAFAAAAGMELLGSSLLLLFSALAALRRDAVWLILAYALSILIPMLLYGLLLARHLQRGTVPPDSGIPVPTGPTLSYAPTAQVPGISAFAAWSMVRLLLVMLFGFLSIWGVGVLEQRWDLISDNALHGSQATAQYAMPFRIAQLLGFVAVTLWASSYGIAARAWSHGQVRRARVQLFRVGKHGMALLLLLSAVLLLGRGIFGFLLPHYARAIDELLPRMLALFIGYGLLSFFSTYADLRETPWKGAAIWGIAAIVQAGGLAWGSRTLWAGWVEAGPWGRWNSSADWMLTCSLAAIAAGLLLAIPLLCRPFRMSATGVPMAILAAASVALLCPVWVVDWVAAPVLLGTVALLLVSGLLIRPLDRRSWRRFRRGRTPRPSFVEPAA